MSEKLWFFIEKGSPENRPVVAAIKKYGLLRTKRAAVWPRHTAKGSALARKLGIRRFPAVFVDHRIAYGKHNVLAVIKNMVDTRVTIDERMRNHAMKTLDEGDESGVRTISDKKTTQDKMAAMIERRRARFERERKSAKKGKSAKARMGAAMRFGETFDMPHEQEKKIALGDENAVRDWMRAEAKRKPNLSKFS